MPIIENPDGSAVYQVPTWQGSYPTYAFPPIIGDAISEASMNLKLPAELAAHAALGVVSLICQNFIKVQCPNFGPAPSSLFLKSIGITSGGKSVLDQRFLRAVVAFERKQKEDVQARLAAYHALLKIWDDADRRLTAKYRHAEPGPDEAQRMYDERVLHEQKRPVEPRIRELRFANLSPEGLRDMLVANGGVGVMSPDAGPVLNGRLFSEPAMLSGYWSGEDHPVALVSGNRRPVEPRLTISVMLQDAPFSEYMKRRGREAFGVGLLARFLVAAPKSNGLQWQETCIEEMPEPKLGFFNERATQVLNQITLASGDPVVLKLSDCAKRYWKYFKDAINHELNKDDHSDDIKAFLRKLAQQASRIAALFHYFDGKSGDISSEAMKSAIALCEWYAHEYIRIFAPYAPSRQQQAADASQKLLDWLQNAVASPWQYSKLTPGRYTERDLNNYSAIRNNPMTLSAAIDALHQQGQISVLHGKKGGRTIIYPAGNFASQPQPFFSPLQPAASAAVGFMGPWNGPPISAMHYGPDHSTQAACSFSGQGLNQPHYVHADSRNVGAAPRSGTSLSGQAVEAGNESAQQDRVNRIEFRSNDMATVRDQLAELAINAFNR